MQCGIVNYSTRQKCFRCQAPRPGTFAAGFYHTITFLI